MMRFGGITPTTLIDYPGKIAAIVFTIGCNFRCPYCHNPELALETVEVEYSETAVLEFLKGRIGMLDGVVITGGEPTIHGDELLAFMGRVKEMGFSVKLDTNGTSPAFIQEACARKIVDYIAMDVKAPLPSYAQLVGMPVSEDDLLSSIRIIMNSGVPYEFRTTIIKALTSRDDIQSIAETIRGAKAYYLQKFVPSNILNPQFLRKMRYTDEEFALLAKIPIPYVEYVGIR